MCVGTTGSEWIRDGGSLFCLQGEPSLLCVPCPPTAVANSDIRLAWHCWAHPFRCKRGQQEVHSHQFCCTVSGDIDSSTDDFVYLLVWFFLHRVSTLYH